MALNFNLNFFDEFENKNDIQTIAHRGYSVEAPENTMSAFFAAKENGYSTIEFDVQWTKDSAPVVLHDKTINRTARNEDGSKIFFNKKCENLTYEELLNYDFGIYKSEEYKSEKIPLFDEVIDFAKDNKMDLYIELKETKDFSEDKAKILVDSVIEADLEDNVTWISFEKDYLKEITELLPDARLGYLSDKKVSKKTIKTLKDLKTQDNEVFLDIKASKINQQGAKLLEQDNFSFESWTVNDYNDFSKVQSLNCSAITTDMLLDSDIAQFLSEIN